MKIQIRNIIYFILILLFTIRPDYAVDRFGIGIRMGFAPNQFSENNQGDRDEGDTNDRIPNRMQSINNYYTNGSNYASLPIIRDFRFDNDTNTSVVTGLDLKYLWKDFQFQLGFSHYSISSTHKSYYSVVGDLTTRANNPNISAYDDINENYDRDNTFVPQALGLYPTNGLEYKFTEFTSGKRLDIPFSVALHLRLATEYSLFIGGGISYHYGKSVRVIEAKSTSPGAKKFTPDIDIFEGRTIGIFYYMSSEYKLTKRLYFQSTITMHNGSTKLLQDSKITGKGTVNSLFHANDENDQGGPEKSVDESVATGSGFKRFSYLSFSGIEFYFGVNFYFTEFK